VRRNAKMTYVEMGDIRFLKGIPFRSDIFKTSTDLYYSELE